MIGKRVYGWGLLLSLIGGITHASTVEFQQQWQLMRQEYNTLMSVLPVQTPEMDACFVHPHWQEQRKQLASIIRGLEDELFLHRACVAGQMVRSEWGAMQDYESAYLQKCISQDTRILLQQFKDTTFGGTALEYKDFNCSINSLSQLFYTARVLELSKSRKIKTIVEFGGGYGCLARINKMINPEITYIIFDLPEYLAIQSLFLRSTLPSEARVHVCEEQPAKFEKGAIYLVPVFYLESTDIKADLFISTFALSESPALVQKIVADKKFFNSSLIYITGQLDGWDSCNFEQHDFMMSAVRSHYPLSVCHPFQGDTVSYELFGVNL